MVKLVVNQVLKMPSVVKKTLPDKTEYTLIGCVYNHKSKNNNLFSFVSDTDVVKYYIPEYESERLILMDILQNNGLWKYVAEKRQYGSSRSDDDSSDSVSSDNDSSDSESIDSFDRDQYPTSYENNVLSVRYTLNRTNLKISSKTSYALNIFASQQLLGQFNLSDLYGYNYRDKKFVTEVGTNSCMTYYNKYVKNVKSLPTISYTQPASIKLPMFGYQKNTVGKMINIENNIHKHINSNLPITVEGCSTQLYYDIYHNRITTETTNNLTINSCGGILADEMGLGKTLSAIALVASKPSTYRDNFKNSRLYSKATVVVCPPHLITQWGSEIKKIMPTAKVCNFITKTTHEKLTYEDVQTADFVLVSATFLVNCKYYGADLLRRKGRFNGGFCITSYVSQRTHIINQIEYTMDTYAPFLEHFHFQRFMIDEGHEFFSDNDDTQQYQMCLPYSMAYNRNQPDYLPQWIMNCLHSDYKWIISGTPIINLTGLQKSLRFLGIKLNGSDIHTFPNNIFEKRFVCKILDNYMIRHTMEGIKNDIQIPQHSDNVIWVDMSSIERSLYNKEHMGNNSSRVKLLQLCCHILVSSADANKHYKYGATTKELSLDEIQEQLIAYHTKQVSINQQKLNSLRKESNPNYNRMKTVYTKAISEAVYMLSVLKRICNGDKGDNIDDHDKTCAVCLDIIDKQSVTPCGHVFCNECIMSCLQYNRQCPLCKKGITESSIVTILTEPKPTNEKTNTIENEFMNKYGSKLGKLTSIVKRITTNENNRIIIFSQFDNMLHLVGKTLASNDVPNTFVTGNVWVKNAAVNKFKGTAKKGKNKNSTHVIMLSLNNAAAGTNLIEATHVIFVEPIDSTKEYIKATETQAIGRACRIGQTKAVQIIRILTRNTIEEEIYNKRYLDSDYFNGENTDLYENVFITEEGETVH